MQPKIKESQLESIIGFKYLLTKVLIHELAHAALDIFNLVDAPSSEKVFYDTDFGKWREESMANAVALRIIKDFSEDTSTAPDKKTFYDNEIEYHYDADLSDVKENSLITIYRIIKECCINSIKHSGGAKLSVSITEEKDHLVICVSDNGKGFDLTKEADKYHYGLKIMEDRVTLLKGKVKITSELGKGYETKITIPFKAIR